MGYVTGKPKPNHLGFSGYVTSSQGALKEPFEGVKSQKEVHDGILIEAANDTRAKQSRLAVSKRDGS